MGYNNNNNNNRISIAPYGRNFRGAGDMLDTDGGCDSTVTTRVRFAWKKFHKYLPILTGKGFSLKLKGKVYATCVRSCLMHGSETWPKKVEHELKMNRTEMSMIRWMCGVKPVM